MVRIRHPWLLYCIYLFFGLLRKHLSFQANGESVVMVSETCSLSQDNVKESAQPHRVVGVPRPVNVTSPSIEQVTYALLRSRSIFVRLRLRLHLVKNFGFGSGSGLPKILIPAPTLAIFPTYFGL
jgi:hypothetical protein